MLTVLAVCLVFVAPTAILALVFAAPRWGAALGEAWRRRLRKRDRLVDVSGRPVERLAADLRRLRPQRVDPRRSRLQREAARLAYEDVLLEAARALGISHALADTPRGLPLELELLRVEQALLDAGLVLASG